MKKLITIMLLLVIVACKNESDIKKDQDNTFLTATINGKEFSSSVKIVSFRVDNQTYLTTADNSDASEYAFTLIIENDKDNDPQKLRYGFIEKEDENGDDKVWKLPNNFDFTSTDEASGYLEGTFFFVANSFNGVVEDSSDQLEVTNGKFRAKKTNY